MPRPKRSTKARRLNGIKRVQNEVNNISHSSDDKRMRLDDTSVLDMNSENTGSIDDALLTSNYILVDSSNLSRIFSNLICTICHSSSLKLSIGQRKGLAHKLKVVCENCEELNIEECTSEQLFPSECMSINTSNAPFDVNMRMVQAMLSLGLGYAAVQKFCMSMNLDIMSSRTFNEYKKRIRKKNDSAVEKMLSETHEKIRKAYGCTNESDIIDIGVSFDGSWMTRGHTSNIGFACVIDILTGFVVDFEVSSKRCGECDVAKRDLVEDTAEFDVWYRGHQDSCSSTHSGSSGSMEVKAALKLWQRSESIGFRYTTLLSDGDSKTLIELKEKKVYGSNVDIQKEECINHVSKRLGTALRQCVKDWRVKGVTLGGRKHGSLKDETIKKLTRYYANAIRRNKGDVEGMKTAIYATLYHCISTDAKPQHKKCPTGKDSWCFYQSALARGKKPGPHKDWVRTAINEEYLPKILPVYQRLASNQLLNRCLRGLTQNSNEALHSMIWNKCSKEKDASRSRVLIAVSSAISEFNCGTLKTLQTFNLPLSKTSKHLALLSDYRRTYFRNKVMSVKYKVAQRKIKLAKLRRLRNEKKTEGVMYKAGYF